MKVIAIKKHSSKLKIWSVEMPNAPYSNRYLQGCRAKSSTLCFLQPLNANAKKAERA
jgi:hypothetical protein